MTNLAYKHNVKRIDNKNIYNYIQSFLDSVGIESDNTKNTYKIAITDYFRDVKGKDLRFVLESDLGTNLLEIEQYQSDLLKVYKRNTVNLKMTAIRMLFEKLSNYGFSVDLNAFNVKNVKNYDTEHYGSLTVKEVSDIADFVSSQRNGNEKKMLVKLAFATAFRKDSLLKLKWSDFTLEGSEVVVRCIGKGNVLDSKKISLELYNELLKIKDSDIVFGKLSSSSVQRMMDSVNKNFDFGDRNITFHSFKKASIEYVAQISNYDLKLMQRHGNHASVTTTLNSYMTNKDLNDLVVVDIDSKNDENMYILGLTSSQVYDIINTMSKEQQEMFKKTAIERGYHVE